MTRNRRQQGNGLPSEKNDSTRARVTLVLSSAAPQIGLPGRSEHRASKVHYIGINSNAVHMLLRYQQVLHSACLRSD